MHPITTPPGARGMPTRTRSESGIAMITALMVISVAALLAVLAASLAFHSQSTSQVDRKRTQAVSAAEAGLDNALLQAQSQTLPCTSTGSLQTQPTTSSYSVTYKYYDTFPPTGASLDCSNPAIVATAKAVEITSTGTTNAKVFGDRTLQALAKLTAIPGTDFNKAIFANNTLTISNNTTVNGNVGNDGDVYATDPFNCANSLTVQGSVYTQGGATLSNSCTIANDLYAKNDIVGSGNGTIGRDAKSSKGNITLNNPRRVLHDAIAFGTVTAAAGLVGNNRVSGATIPDPPSQPFPQIPWNPATSPGKWNTGVAPYQFSNVITNNACSGGSSVYTTIASLSAPGPDTIVVTNCALAWSGNTSISFGRNVAIFSFGGFSTSNNFTMQSSVPGTTRRLYWIVPYNAVGSVPCASPGITTGNLTKFIDEEVFFYSPCNISAANQQATKGQVYGGSNVAIQNNFTLSYVPVPVTDIQNSTALPLGYNVDIVYKRETKSTS